MDMDMDCRRRSPLPRVGRALSYDSRQRGGSCYQRKGRVNRQGEYRPRRREVGTRAFRECARAARPTIGTSLAIEFAQSRASGCRCRRDCFHPLATSRPAIALATFRASAPALVDANARDRFRPSASVGGRRASGDEQVQDRSEGGSCFHVGAVLGPGAEDHLSSFRSGQFGAGSEGVPDYLPRPSLARPRSRE
jgi:hypothetical protein